VIGTGRGGAALGPIVSGFLFAAGWSLSTVAIAMAMGSLVAAIAILVLVRHQDGRAGLANVQTQEAVS
jgi:hypothetical protein